MKKLFLVALAIMTLVTGFLTFEAFAKDPANKRHTDKVTVTLNDSTEKTDEFAFEDRCLVAIEVGTVVTTNITSECAAASGGTFKVRTDTAGDTITVVTGMATNDYIDLTADGKEICGCLWGKLVAVTDQTTDRTDWVLYFAR